MSHSPLTPEEIEFLRSGPAARVDGGKADAAVAVARAVRLPRGGTDSASDEPLGIRPPHNSREPSEARAEGAFGEDQLYGLRVIHEQFARQAAEALRGPLRAPVAIRVERVEQRSFGETVFDLQNPTCLQVLTGGQSAVRPVLLEMQLGILFPMMDRLLGGQEGDPIVARGLTEIERRLVSRLTGILLVQLSAAWSRVAPIQWEVETLESNPQVVRCVSPGEPCAVVVMEIAFGRARGQIRGVFPHHAMASLQDTIAAQQGSGNDDHQAAGDDGKSPDDAVHLSVTLAESTLSRSDLLGLQVGDILATESDAESPATIMMDGVRELSARVGTHEGHKAVRIEALPEDGEPSSGPLGSHDS